MPQIEVRWVAFGSTRPIESPLVRRIVYSLGAAGLVGAGASVPTSAVYLVGGICAFAGASRIVFFCFAKLIIASHVFFTYRLGQRTIEWIRANVVAPDLCAASVGCCIGIVTSIIAVGMVIARFFPPAAPNP